MRSQGVHGVSEACCRRMGAGEIGKQGISKQLQNSLDGEVTHPGLSHPELSNCPLVWLPVSSLQSSSSGRMFEPDPTPWDRVGGVPGPGLLSFGWCIAEDAGSRTPEEWDTSSLTSEVSRLYGLASLN